MWITGVGGWLTATLGLCWRAMTFLILQQSAPRDLHQWIISSCEKLWMVEFLKQEWFILYHHSSSPLSCHLFSVLEAILNILETLYEDMWAVWRCKAGWNTVGGLWKWRKTDLVDSPQCFLGADLKRTVPWQSWDIVLEKSGQKSRTGPWLRPPCPFHNWILQDKTQLSRFDSVSGDVQNYRHLLIS